METIQEEKIIEEEISSSEDGVIKLTKLQEEYILTKMAAGNVGNFSEGLYYHTLAFLRLLSIVGDKHLKEKLGEDKWKQIKIKIMENLVGLQVCNSYRIGIEMSQYGKEDIGSVRFQKFQESLMKIDLIHYWLYFCMDILVQQTSLSYSTGIAFRFYERVKTPPYKFNDRASMASQSEMGDEE